MWRSSMFLLCLTLAVTIRKAEAEKERGYAERWALLVAGSKGWFNYRHQADVAHAYQLLRRGGISEKRMVVMMYDDIAYNPLNPFPGKIFNRPGGSNVYKGINIDYRGSDVNVDTFIAVLLGNKTGVIGRGTERVLDSGEEDHVFVYYADHGGYGILGMPEPPYLYADTLNSALQEKQSKGGFNKLVIYVEACESGSIFQGFLGSKSNIYAVTASNAVESSWGTYCPTMDKAKTGRLNVCLGDLFSVSWMEDRDSSMVPRESLQEQYIKVFFRTSMNLTYTLGSHVMQFGTLCWIDRPCSEFVGDLTNNTTNIIDEEYTHISQRDADLVPLLYDFNSASVGSLERTKAYAALMKEYRKRDELNKAMSLLLTSLDRGSELGTGVIAGKKLPLSLEKKSKEVSGPIVEDWDCLRDLVSAWEHAFGQLGAYGMQYASTFASLCNSGAEKSFLLSTINYVRQETNEAGEKHGKEVREAFPEELFLHSNSY